jgi:DNA-binding transcriptional ArsR family regulator
MALAELVLHPQRLRIVQALLGREGLTTADLRRALPDLPSATLYRHIGQLLDADVIRVVEERQVRGAVERTYALGSTVVGGEEARTMSPDQHLQAFVVFVSGLLSDFERYLDRGDADLERDLAGYRQAALHLTDQEMLAMVEDLNRALLPWLEKGPGPGRRRRMFSTVLIPADKEV